VENETNEQKVKKNQTLIRYFLVVLLLGFVVVGIVVSAFNTAFVERSKWEDIAKNLERPNKLILPRRGNIYSEDGRLMASSIPTYYITMDTQTESLLQKEGKLLYDNIDSLSYYLSRYFKDRSAAGYKQMITQAYRRGDRQLRIYPRRISYIQLKEVQAFPLFKLGRNSSGLIATEYIRREKPFGSLASRTIGDVYGEIEQDGLSKGRNGLELQYDSLLRGEAGLNSVRRVGGRWTDVVEIEAKPGMDIHTTIDIDIQEITEKSLVDMLKSIDAESGTAVVMEVKTGEIKAITNMARISDKVYAESINHAVADEIEPGSTFKIASMMVALEDGICQPSDTIDVGNGIYMYGSARMTDHNMNSGGYGRISAEQAIWYSSNIGVAKIILKGYEQNPTKFVEGLYKLGLNIPLDLEIPGSGRAKIRMPNDTLNYWSRTTLPWMSFGYETQIPPIYTLTFFNAIANGGKMVRPMFTKEIINNGKVEKKFSPTVLKSSICSNNTLKIIQDMLLGVVEKGTGRAVHSDAISIAGKTGTAQIASGGVYRTSGHQVTFCGYFPAENPIYSCIVVIRRPRIGYASGGAMSGVVVKNIAERIHATSMPVNIKDVEPDSTAVLLPQPKSGSLASLEQTLGALKINFDTDSVKTDWVAISKNNKDVNLKDINIIDGLVPNTIGMGAKDAVFIMESAGLRVNISGTGRVVSQSITPGARITRGQYVSLTLK
jgi:Cell division protein FtsI/penicillin-binding protein 2